MVTLQKDLNGNLYNSYRNEIKEVVFPAGSETFFGIL